MISDKEKIRRFDRAYVLVQEQAEDYGLWFIAKYASEEYLQNALRKLTAMIEDDKIEELLL